WIDLARIDSRDRKLLVRQRLIHQRHGSRGRWLRQLFRRLSRLRYSRNTARQRNGARTYNKATTAEGSLRKAICKVVLGIFTRHPESLTMTDAQEKGCSSLSQP